MRYLKISITGGENGEMIYPENYEQEIGRFASDHLYFDDGIDYNLLLCIYNSNFNDSMIRAGVEEIDEQQAKLISETYEKRTEIIKDEAKLRRIELRARLGLPLSEEDQACIDPNSPTSIFVYTKILADKIDTHKQVESGLQVLNN